MNILLLGADGNAGQNYAKNVSSKHVVYGTGLNRWHILASENIQMSYNLSGTTPPEKFQDIVEIIETHDIDFIHAQPDGEVYWLINNQEELEKRIGRKLTTGHDFNTWKLMSDKSRFADHLKEIFPTLAFSVPATLVNRGVQFDDIRDAGAGMVWCRSIIGSGSKYAMPCSSVSELEYWASYVNEHHAVEIEHLMVSPYLPGNEYAVQTFFWNGELIHLGARQRVEHVFAAQMASGQSSSPSVAVSVVDERVTQAALDSIYAFGTPHGIYCVDLREDIYGNPVPTEINYGRYFTTSTFMASIGMNTPLKELDIFKRGYAIKEDFHIDDIEAGYYWIRQMDKTPYLTKVRSFS